MIDSIPPEFGIPFAVVALIAWFVIEVRHAPSDPDPQYSRLDRMDGLPHTD